MARLLSIGRFSNLTGLTQKALRLSDRLGIFRPAAVDVTSGYRYYGEDQLAVAHTVARLRAVQMPLAEIGALVSADDPDVMRQRLELHRQQIRAQISRYERALCAMPIVEELIGDKGKDKVMEPAEQQYRCSFCGKLNHEVGRMIAGPEGVIICDLCVALCNQVIDETEQEEGAKA